MKKLLKVLLIVYMAIGVFIIIAADIYSYGFNRDYKKYMKKNKISVKPLRIIRGILLGALIWPYALYAAIKIAIRQQKILDNEYKEFEKELKKFKEELKEKFKN